jgi:hypothetical protein
MKPFTVGQKQLSPFNLDQGEGSADISAHRRVVPREPRLHRQSGGHDRSTGDGTIHRC